MAISSGATAPKPWRRRVARSQDKIGPASASLPPSRFALWRDKLRRYGAASFACIHERRMVDQNIASWNRISSWLRQLKSLQAA
jgi:hypothetical protein